MKQAADPYAWIDIQREMPPENEALPSALGDAGTPPQAANAPVVTPQIDVAALAKKVYALLKKELRLERERPGRSRRY